MIDCSLNELYRVAGLSKQAVYQYRRRAEDFERRLQGLVAEMDELRVVHPGCGLQKAYYTLRPDFLGRDRFIACFQQLGYSLRKRKPVRPRTTLAGRLRFGDRIEGGSFDGPGQVWQSDITYYGVGDQFYYLVFLIDIYSKVIVGHRVSDHMRAQANLAALQRAIDRYGAPRIHHSDRGTQYTSDAYLGLLNKHGVEVSQARSARHNAYAERINRTIKEEFLDHQCITSLPQLKAATGRAVDYYNHRRLHDHLKRMPPLTFLKGYPALPRKERPIVNVPILNL